MDWEGSLLSQMSAIRGLGWLRRRLPQTGTAPGAVRDLAMRDGTEQNRARDARPGAARTRRPHCTAARGGSTSRHPNPLPAAACERSNNGAAQFAPRRACNRVLRAVCGDRQAVRSPPPSPKPCQAPTAAIRSRWCTAGEQWPAGSGRAARPPCIRHAAAVTNMHLPQAPPPQPTLVPSWRAQAASYIARPCGGLTIERGWHWAVRRGAGVSAHEGPKLSVQRTRATAGSCEASIIREVWDCKQTKSPSKRSSASCG